jgi:hypothetical protein
MGGKLTSIFLPVIPAKAGTHFIGCEMRNLSGSTCNSSMGPGFRRGDDLSRSARLIGDT